MNIENKKSAVDLTDLAIGLVVLGIAVTIGAVILTNIGNSQITSASTYQVVNESVSVNSAGKALSQTWVKSVDAVWNATGVSTPLTGNYTTSISSDNGVGTITNTTGTYNPNTWKVTYTVYNVSDPRYDLASKASTGLGEYGNWFKIIVIVGVAAVVLSLIFMAFGRKGSAGSQAY